MTEIAKKPIKITETILRDAHQSLIATRMSTEQMLPIIEKLDDVVSAGRKRTLLSVIYGSI